MKEIWMYTKGTSKYEVSNLGRVRSVVTKKILKHAIDRGGYHSVVLYPQPCVRMFALVHRLVAFAFIPNLEWSSPKENMRHAFNSGLKNNKHMIGKKNPLSRLDEDKVLKIRSIKKKKQISNKSLAFLFRVSESCIANIISGNTWTHV